MRLLFLTNLYPPFELGGYEQWCFEIAQGLRVRGHEVYILTSRHRADESDRPEPHIYRTLYLQADFDHYQPVDFFRYRPRQEAFNRLELKRVLEAARPDLVVVWGMYNLSRWLPYWLEQWLPQCVAYYLASYWPADMDIHLGYWQSPAGREVSNLVKWPFSRLAEWRLKREAYPPKLSFKQAACCSHYVKDRLVSQEFIPKSSRVIPGAVDIEPYLDIATGRQMGDGDQLRLLYFGSLVRHKGVHTAVEALKEIRARGNLDGLSLTILGSGHSDYELELKQLVESHGLGRQVTFVPKVPMDEIPSWLARHDIFLFTSVWDEPFGRVIVEAMAAGLVVLGASVGGSMEIFRQYDEDLLFPPEDSRALAEHIIRVKNDPALRERLALQGPALARTHFTIGRMTDDIVAWLAGIHREPGGYQQRDTILE